MRICLSRIMLVIGKALAQRSNTHIGDGAGKCRFRTSVLGAKEAIHSGRLSIRI